MPCRRILLIAGLAFGISAWAASVALGFAQGRTKVPTPPLEQAYWSASIFAALVSVLSLVFVVREVSALRRALNAQMFDVPGDRMQQLAKIGIDEPELLELLDGSAEFESVGDSYKAFAFAAMHVDAFDTEILRRKQFPTATKGLPHFDHWIEDFFASSETARNYLEENRKWYSFEIYNIMRSTQNQEFELADEANRSRNFPWINTQLKGAYWGLKVGDEIEADSGDRYVVVKDASSSKDSNFETAVISVRKNRS